MGALVVAMLAAALGAGAGSAAARRLLSGSLTAHEPWLRLGRLSVVLLGAIAGAEIAAQVYDLVHQLQLNASLYSGSGGRFLREANLLDVTLALRGVLFYGVLLIGLTTIVAQIAERRERVREPN